MVHRQAYIYMYLTDNMDNIAIVTRPPRPACMLHGGGTGAKPAMKTHTGATNN